MFAVVLEDYLENRMILPEHSAKQATLLHLEDALRFYKEYLKWKYRLEEGEEIFSDVKELCSSMPEKFTSSEVVPYCETEAQAIKLAQQVWKSTDGLSSFGIKGGPIKRTTITHIRELVVQIDAEGLASFDTKRPITWLSLAFLIESRHKLNLTRHTRRNKSGARNGSQEYSIAGYIKRWIDWGHQSLKQEVSDVQFSYNKIHSYIMQFVVYAEIKRRGWEANYAQGRVLFYQALKKLGAVFLYYNYECAVNTISQFIQDIHKLYWSVLANHLATKTVTLIPYSSNLSVEEKNVTPNSKRIEK